MRYSPVFRDQAWRRVALKRQTPGEQAWEVKAARVLPIRDGEATRRGYWPIVARHTATGEVKYFVSNAPADMPLERLPRIAFMRWNVEHGFRVAKTEIGFGHYEGRNYTGLIRHLLLCLVVLGFVAGQADRLRGEKPGGDAGAGVPSVEPTVRGVAGEPAGNVRVGPHVRGHRLSPAA